MDARPGATGAEAVLALAACLAGQREAPPGAPSRPRKVRDPSRKKKQRPGGRCLLRTDAIPRAPHGTTFRRGATSSHSSGTISSATMLMILINGLIAGPAVSL